MSFKNISSSLLLAALAISAASAFASSEPTPVEAASYDVDSGHSLVIFKIRHLGVANFYGTFDNVTGEITYDEKKPGSCSVKVEVDSNSIDSNSDDRNALLKDKDFFNSAEHPTWSFESTSVKKGKKGMFTLVGDLTMRGITKSIEGQLEVVGSGSTFMGDRAGWEASFTIDRNDFEISGVPGGLGAEVEVIVSLEGVKKSE